MEEFHQKDIFIFIEWYFEHMGIIAYHSWKKRDGTEKKAKQKTFWFKEKRNVFFFTLNKGPIYLGILGSWLPAL